MALTKVTPNIVEETIQQTGFKNKIIGGDFSTNPWQRGTSFAAVASGAYTADRWAFSNSSGGVVTILKGVDAPAASEAGMFTQHCLQTNVTTADASIAAGEQARLEQRIEGLNATSFGFGRGGTRNVTLSFWHKHTKTGVHCVSIINSASNRAYVAEYTQDVTNTWEKATITIPVDTSGTWLYDNGIGLRVSFALSAGTNFQTTANTWNAGFFLATANQVNNLDSTANSFRIALVQLEAGSKASSFEARSVGQELALCQRYFTVKINTTNLPVVSAFVDGRGFFTFQVRMRATPTCTFTYDTGSGATFAIGPDGGYQTGVNSSVSAFSFTANAEL